MDDQKDQLKNTPLTALDGQEITSSTSSTQTVTSTNPSPLTPSSSPLNSVDEERFTNYNPLLSDNIKFKRLYWSSRTEIIARVLLLFVSCCHLIFAYFLTNNVINDILINRGIMEKTISNMWLIVLLITFAFNFCFYLPLAIARSASAIFAWSIVYISLAIVYFIALELFCTLLLVIDGLITEEVSLQIPIFMVTVLLITILWLIAACLLIVKSDDVRRELSVE